MVELRSFEHFPGLSNAIALACFQSFGIFDFLRQMLNMAWCHQTATGVWCLI